MTRPRTLYDILEVDPKADADAIRAAYRRQARRTHPDREGGNHAEMAAINEAMAVLGDPERRRRYDETGDTSKAPELDQLARGILSQELAGLVAAEEWGNPIFALREALVKVEHDTVQAITVHKVRARTLERRSQSFRNVSGEDFLRGVFTERLEEARRALAACEQLRAAILRAREILCAYQFDDQAPLPHSLIGGSPPAGKRWINPT